MVDQKTLSLGIAVLLNLGMAAPLVGQVVGRSAVGQSGGATVKVSVYPSIARSIGGELKLDRLAYFNVHGFPTSDVSDQELRTLLKTELNFGRGFGVTWGMQLVKTSQGGERLDPRSLAETSARMKKGNLQNQRRVGGRGRIEAIQTTHPHSFYPSDEEKQKRKNAGTYVALHPDQIAGSMADYFESQGTQLAAWFEPMNECSVKAGKLGVDFSDMCDQHALIAQKFHQRKIRTRVGGPALAWPSFQMHNFGVWESGMKLFMDRAGNDVDFFSIHLYGRTGANIDAVLDLIESYSQLQLGEVKPILITEFAGAVDAEAGNVYDPRQCFNVTHVSHAMVMQFMDRADRMPRNVPFHTLKGKWFKGHYPYSLFRKTGDQYELTGVLDFYRFWAGVRGARVYCRSQDPDVLVQAFRDRNQVHLIMHNLDPQPRTVSVNLGSATLENVKTALHQRGPDGGPVLNQPDAPIDGQTLTLGPNETLRVSGRLNGTPKYGGTVEVSTWYANQVVQPIEGKTPVRFRIERPSDADGNQEDPQIRYAMLRVSVGRPKKLKMNPRVRFNGKLLKVPGDLIGPDQKKFQDPRPNGAWLEAVTIPVPAQWVRSQNQAEVYFPDAGGHVSSVTLTVGAVKN